MRNLWLLMRSHDMWKRNQRFQNKQWTVPGDGRRPERNVAWLCNPVPLLCPLQDLKERIRDWQRQCWSKARTRLSASSLWPLWETGTKVSIYLSLVVRMRDDNCWFWARKNFAFVFKPGDNPNKPINPLVTGAFGAIAGAASVFGNTPLDVIKTRMQVGIRIRNVEDYDGNDVLIKAIHKDLRLCLLFFKRCPLNHRNHLTAALQYLASQRS